MVLFGCKGLLRVGLLEGVHVPQQSARIASKPEVGRSVWNSNSHSSYCVCERECACVSVCELACLHMCGACAHTCRVGPDLL